MNLVHHHAEEECSFAISSRSCTLSSQCWRAARARGSPCSSRHSCCHSTKFGTGGAPRDITALRGTTSGPVQLRRLSCSGSAAIPAIVPSFGTGNGSGDRLRPTGFWRLSAYKTSGCCPIVALRASSKAALPNPSLKRTHNGTAVWPSSAGASPHFALAVQPAMPLCAA